jgi:uncharacterized protein YndB with AHSA1/START domain
VTDRSVTHATFTIERTYDAPPARVFAAFADPDLKARWFAGPEEWGPEDLRMDFRIGGGDVSRGGPKTGPIHTFESRYYDIVPDERIIFSYDMTLDEARISVSLATVQLEEQGSGTRLTYTEQGAFLEGYDDPGERERGTRELLEAIERALQEEPVRA